MNPAIRRGIAAFALLLASNLFAQAPPAPVNTTQVLAFLTIRPGIARDQIMKVMNDEVKSTVRLYLDGKIQQWWARGDGKGVVFLMDCKQVSDARAVLETLPLIKANFAEFEYIPV
ncbi:MAG: hypothetical protein ABI822_16280, partial [Bryobacteraceae bacterium]